MKMNNFLSFTTSMKVFFVAAVACVMTTTSTFAQSVTDEELRQYAVVMDSIDAMKQNIQEEYNALIQEEELMQGGRRFVEIQQVGDDSVRLSELNVTEMELETFNKIQQKYEEMTTEFKENYTNLIKEDLGASLYNKVSKALKEDSEAKTRYESILEQVKSENASDDASGQNNQEEGTGVGTGTSTGTSTETGTETGTENQTEMGTETETGTENQTEIGTETETGTENPTEIGTGTETGTEIGTETETGTENQTETDTNVDTNPADDMSTPAEGTEEGVDTTEEKSEEL